MATVPQRPKHQLRVSSYDKVSSWIVSLLIIMGVTVGALFIVFITQNFIIEDFAVPVMPVASGGGGTTGFDGTPGDGDPDTPVEEATAFEEPIQDTLDSLVTVVTNRTAMLDQQLDVIRETHGDNRNPGLGGGSGGGIGGGIGSGFGPGRGGAEPRREIRFEPASLQEYALWLDFFKIELGVLNVQENKVYYASRLSQQRPVVRTGEPSQDTRLYMNPTDSQFAALDRQLIAKAGLTGKGQIILQFYPNESAAILIGQEQKLATSRGRALNTIRGTVFRVTRTGDRFEFSVIDQSYK